ncbi:MAG: glucose-6-phosphate dehydrogenase, partial [Alphaproteobacteria bacterium]|nr:glucose-6-phosphate dehydrogenase [Alphaproteobacteria bacterium]
MTLRAMPLSLSLAEPNMRRRIAYERLFHDALGGNRTLSVGREEAERAWAWVDRISAAWREAGEPPKPYAAGSWGPAGAFALIERFGRAWND